MSRLRRKEREAVKERKKGFEGKRDVEAGGGALAGWSAGAWLPSTEKKRRWRGSGWSPLSLSLFLPLSPCDCQRLQGEGSRLCRLSDGSLLRGGSYVCACKRRGAS